MALRKRKTSRSSDKSNKSNSRRWLSFLLPVFLWGGAIFAVWCVWIDYRIRKDFEALQWALPARLYARPVELYVGAHLTPQGLTDYLRQLGYRQARGVAGPGEYQVSESRVRVRTRGFKFWDGDEPSVYADVNFDGRFISALQGEGSSELPLVRLEPVEIAQINPTTGEDRLPITLTDVPPELVKAVIDVEDQRFYSHIGVDPIGIARAMVANIKAGGIVQGGSTLTQQVIKNLYLTREQTITRKAEEAVMALALELHFTKDQILTAYLNEVFLGQAGNRAIHGFALAAQYYYGRPLNELRLDELALLAGIARGASYYNPIRNTGRATLRRNVVLNEMLEKGDITQEQFDRASTAEVAVREKAPNRSGYPAFMELVYSDLGRDYDEDALRTEGLRIFTTLDLAMQSTVEARLDDAVKAVEHPSEGDPLQAAVVITDANTGEVRALAGGRKSGYTGFNRALQAKRPIGSLVKPAVYLTALETPDFNLATVLADERISLKQPNGGVWEPENYEKTTDGDVYLYDALQRSLNLATVDLGMKVGAENVAEMIGRLGFTGKVQTFPSLFLGAVDMSPIEVAQMYQTLASNGFRSPLRAVEAVTTAEGEPLAFYGIETKQVADPASVYLLEYAMHGVFDRGTARTVANQLSSSLPLAGKTGTTNDLRDSWFAGYGSDLVGVVWLGHDDNRETGLTGATGALRVWTDIMKAIDIQPRQIGAPAEVKFEKMPAVAVRDPSQRDCSTTELLPFHQDHLPDVAWSCEVTDSFFDRVLDRFRSFGQ